MSLLGSECLIMNPVPTTLSLSSLRASGRPVDAAVRPPCACGAHADGPLCLYSEDYERQLAPITHVFGWRSRPLETVGKSEYGYFLISYASPQGPRTPLEASFVGFCSACFAAKPDGERWQNMAKEADYSFHGSMVKSR